MRALLVGRQSIASLVVGLVIGVIGGLLIGSNVTIESDQWWSLAGSAGGAFLAIAGGVWLFHYQQQEGQRAERRRLAEQIDDTLKGVKLFKGLSSESFTRYNDMLPIMRTMVLDYRSVADAVSKFKHTSAEIGKAANHLGSQAEQVWQVADADKDAIWLSAAVCAVEELEDSLLKARRELGV